MSPFVGKRILLSVTFCTVTTVVTLLFLSSFPGLKIPPFYWGVSVVFPIILSSLVSWKLAKQSEELCELNQELMRSHDLLKVVADSDSLTTLLNRGGFFRHIEALPLGTSGWLLIIDVDRFKSINDRFGHRAGDKALQSIAAIMKMTVRPHDYIGRIGGEEFGVYLPEVDEAKAMLIAERLRHQVEVTPVPVTDDVSIHMTISIGISKAQRNEAITDSLYIADKALYSAKHGGRNQIRRAA
ncbi:MAG: GGDEF domain-containing protein [Sphingobium sp.]|nr:GGDEF domain-containing protein [Sphingobium sp.]